MGSVRENSMGRGLARATALSAIAFFAMLFMMVGTAYAAPTVTGADYHATGSAVEAGEIDVLNVAGATGETVFVSVSRNGSEIAKYIPYTLGEGNTKGSGDNWTGVVTLDISTFDTSALDGSYTVSAYATRAGGAPIYEGALYGVYAQLSDGTVKLIGTRTIGTSDAADRTFTPNDTIYSNGMTYKLVGAAQGEGSLVFPYEAYDEATTVDGVIRYVDSAGETVTTQKIPGLVYGESRDVSIPSVVEGDNGDLYRTVYFRDTLNAVNPGATSFVVTCAKMSDSEKAASNFYVATIQLVDENDRVIATDTVNVTGVYRYTAPSTIYKTETVDETYGEQAVITYNLVDEATVTLDPAKDGVTTHARTVKVRYQSVPPDPPTIDVTYNLIDGTKRANDPERIIGTVVKHLDSENPTAVPDLEVETESGRYLLAGDQGDYAYFLRSGKVPVVNVYYTPEGYTPPGPYEVTVSYVNFLTGDVVGSQSVTSSPDENAAVTIETPETFSADGVDYVRLDGQDEPITHSYYSGITSYTVYYRDKNDTLTSGTVINRIQVVYTDNVVTVDGSTTDESTDDGTSSTVSSEVSNALQLNGSRTYNVLDGEGNNATLTNEEGVDSNTERIEEEENPLAAGLDGTATDVASARGFIQALPAWVIPACVIAAVALGAIVIAVVIRRRKRDAESEA